MIRDYIARLEARIAEKKAAERQAQT